MHSSLIFHSYMKPATSPQVPKMCNEVQVLRYFSISLNVTWFNFHRVLTKNSR